MNCYYFVYNNMLMFEKLKYRLTYRRRMRSMKYALTTKKLLDKTLAGVSTEARETEEMASAFFRLLSTKLNLDKRTDPPTEEEVKKAIEQLKDVGRLSIFATISIIPGGGFSLIGLEMLARKFGITNFTFVPSSFRKNKTRKPDTNQTQ